MSGAGTEKCVMALAHMRMRLGCDEANKEWSTCRIAVQHTKMLG
jgi:hypothetical protein